jgi:hypothetical protein
VFELLLKHFDLMLLLLDQECLLFELDQCGLLAALGFADHAFQLMTQIVVVSLVVQTNLK